MQRVELAPVLFSERGLGSGHILFFFLTFPQTCHVPFVPVTGYHHPLHMASSLHFHPSLMMDFKPHLPQEAFLDSQDALLTSQVPRAETVVPTAPRWAATGENWSCYPYSPFPDSRRGRQCRSTRSLCFREYEAQDNVCLQANTYCYK